MITFAMFVSLWICTAKDIRAAKYLTWAFLAYLVTTALFRINYIYLLPILAIFLFFAVYALIIPWREYYVKKTRKWKKRWIKHPGEVLAYRVSLLGLRLLPLPVLSWIGGRLLQWGGPKSKRRQKIMSDNLAMIMPENNNPEFMRRVWNNWGRVFAEGLKFSTYRRNIGKYLTFKNREEMFKYPQYLIAMPHFGYMGLMSLAFADTGINVGVTYKYPSNPLTNDIILENYGMGQVPEMHYIPVGNAIPMVRALRSGYVLNINSDQRTGSGIYLDFVGRPARTSTGIAQLARKFDLPILVGHIRRTRGARHEIVFDEFVNVPKTDNQAADEIAGTQMVNDAMSRIIKNNPSEYLWMHRRWR